MAESSMMSSEMPMDASSAPVDDTSSVMPTEPSAPFDIVTGYTQIESDRFATRIIVMVAGGILVEGTPQEIAADPRVREVYLGGANHG